MSSKQYICELCKKEFKQKSDFQKHSNKKTPCISLNEIQKITQTKETKISNLSNLTSIFKNCLDVLRDNEHLTGDKALRTLAHLLDLRLLEHQFGKTIDIDNFKYDFSDYGFTEKEEQEHKMKLLQIVRFSKLAESKEANLPTNMKYLWKDILSVHPKTKNIFLEGKGFDITNQSTYKKLITKLNTFDFESIEEDVLGEAYEEVIKDVMIGKTLGQFFTPPKVKKMMVRLIDPLVKADGTIETIFDPAMGTGGFLINCLRHLITQSKVKNINLDWEFIRKFGVGGREAEPDTYQLAVSNMLISSGQMFDEKLLQKGDTIRDPITNKYDIVFANPPFGIDGLDYNDIEHKLRNEYLPIKSNSAVPLFLQAIIYMLRIGGRCAVVLPEGQELFSKNKALSSVREFLMKTCDLKEVIYLPAGTFTHTSIKTCVFYFIKKRECNDALTIKIKTSKTTNKETEREYDFSKTHMTSKVNFYDFNPDNGVKHPLLEVLIEELSKNSYSLNYAEYLKDTVEEEKYEDGIVIKKLGEVCELQNGKRIVKDQVETGEYPVYGGGGLTSFYTNQYTREGKTCKISREGMSLHNCVLMLNEKYYLNSQALTIISKSDILLNEYLWYYLNNNKELVFECGRGTAQKAIDVDAFKNIKIPIPSLEKQKEIVSYLDFIYEKCNKTSNDKIEELKRLNEFCLNNQRVFGENEMNTLEKISSINPESMKLGQFKEINYIDISSVKEGILSDVKNLKEDFPSRAKRVIKKGDILYSSVRPNLRGYTIINDNIINGIASTGFAQIRITEKDILPKYVYFMLTTEYITDILVSKAKGAQYPAVSFSDFETLKIPVPSLEKQKEIIEYCESNNNLIKLLENEIEQNKIQANLFLSSIVKKVVTMKVDDDNDDIEDESESEYEIISYKNKNYILDNMELFEINDDKTKGELFAKYKNSKVKKIQKAENEIVV
jgi:type I restriction-modification system DNA methylase subunit/restriction endonuclease S subunit